MLARIGASPLKLTGAHTLKRALHSTTPTLRNAFASTSTLPYSPLPATTFTPPTRRTFTSTSTRALAEVVDEPFDLSTVERVSDEVDVCIVGAGPAGLSAAIRLMKQAKEQDREIRVVVLEKGAEVGEWLGCSDWAGISLGPPAESRSSPLLIQSHRSTHPLGRSDRDARTG